MVSAISLPARLRPPDLLHATDVVCGYHALKAEGVLV